MFTFFDLGMDYKVGVGFSLYNVYRNVSMSAKVNLIGKTEINKKKMFLPHIRASFVPPYRTKLTSSLLKS